MKQFFTCVLACALLASCGFFSPRSINRIKNDSPLRQVIQPEGYNYDDAKIKTAVLQQIAPGVSRQQIEAFLAQNFTGVAYSVSTKSVPGVASQSPQACVFVRPVDISNSSGGEHVDIYLLLDSSEHLRDVVVESHRSYL